MKTIVQRMLGLLLAVLFLAAAQWSAAAAGDYVLGSGDVVRITVFQNPDLTTETRVAESGTVSFPLLGSVAVGGLTVPAAEQLIAKRLREGGFVLKPQVTLLVVQMRGSQVAVLGQVNRPGRFPLETFDLKLTGVLAMAGGITTGGADTVVLTGTRAGKPMRMEIDLPSLFLDEKGAEDVPIAGGDVIYVHRAPVFYIYGEVQRPGAYRVERGMTVMQALALGGGPTLRGTERGLRLHRRAGGKVQVSEPAMDEPVRADDVLYVRESLF
ncbi:MAG: hypothetical protein OHK0026_11630 [Rhodocyclaceae bacterium]